MLCGVAKQQQQQKHFYLSTDTIKKSKYELWENIFAKHITGNGIVSKYII